MHEVAALAARAALDMGAAAGVLPDDVLRSLPFDRRALDTLKRIDWDQYCAIVEGLEEALGGPEQLDALLVTSYHDSFPPPLKTFLRSLVSSRVLFSVFMRASKLSWSNVDAQLDQVADGRSRVSWRLHPGYRPCFTFFRGSISTCRGAVGHLGLPPIDAEVLELTGTSLVVLLSLPASETLVARARRASGKVLQQAARGIVGLYLTPGVSLEDAIARDDPALHRLVEHVELEPFADAVMHMSIELGWQRAALHVVPTDRNHLVALRIHGPEIAPRHFLSLATMGREIGLLEVGGGGDIERLRRLVPGITALLEATLLMTMAAHDTPSPAALSPRERETLACLLQGMSEKEVAASLAVSAHTVHHYVRGIYRAFGVSSRNELLARFVARWT